MKADYIRTPQDLANEFDAVHKTVAARISRLPVTAEGLAYADAMRAIAASVEPCVTRSQVPGVGYDDDGAEFETQVEQACIVQDAEGQAAAVQLLEDARAKLLETLPAFLALDLAQAHAKPRVAGPDQIIGATSV